MIKKCCFSVLGIREQGLLVIQFTQVTVRETDLERRNNILSRTVSIMRVQVCRIQEAGLSGPTHEQKCHQDTVAR